MRRISCYACVVLVCTLFSGLPASASDLGAVSPAAGAKASVSNTSPVKMAEGFIHALTQEGIGFLGDSSMSDEARKRAFKKLLNKNFDMKTLARFSLGRYWRTASEDQRKEYMSLFQKMIIEVYSKRFSDYKGQKVEIKASRTEGNNGDILVNSVILQKNAPEIQLDWRVRFKNGEFKVVDVIVEGVSMAVTQRSDFASVIQRGGGDINVLLAHLRQ